MRVAVDCYAGYKADERPQRFTLRGRLFEVLEILDRWYDPEAIFFRVRADDGNIYILRHDERVGDWTLESFRAAR
jgi:hypothetical protein